MTVKELNDIIDWCRTKIKHTNLTGKRKEGYKEAMLVTMSYLSDLKNRTNDKWKAV